jgi:hypothetical protein
MIARSIESIRAILAIGETKRGPFLVAEAFPPIPLPGQVWRKNGSSETRRVTFSDGKIVRLQRVVQSCADGRLVRRFSDPTIERPSSAFDGCDGAGEKPEWELILDPHSPGTAKGWILAIPFLLAIVPICLIRLAIVAKNAVFIEIENGTPSLVIERNVVEERIQSTEPRMATIRTELRGDNRRHWPRLLWCALLALDLDDQKIQ